MPASDSPRRPTLRAYPALLLTLTLLLPLTALAEEKTSLDIGEWLVLDAAPLPSPAFRADDAEEGEILGDLVLTQGDLWPSHGREASWPPGQAADWQARSAPVALDAGNIDGPAAAWLACCSAQPSARVPVILSSCTSSSDARGAIATWPTRSQPVIGPSP